MKKVTPITNEYLKKQNEDYLKSSKNLVLRNALSNVDISDVVRSHDNASNTRFMFDIDIEVLNITNQKASGRCWIFAALNILREIIAKKVNITKEFELSQAYVALYDKFEKVNYALETIIDLLDVDYDDRTLSFVLQRGIQDGGQWDLFVNIVKKYGVCPKCVLDETSQSNATREVNSLLDATIRKFASDAKIVNEEKGFIEVLELQQQVLAKCYSLLLDCYGKPVSTFDFEYVDKDKNYHIEKGLTPKTFFDKYIGNEIDDYVSLINAPTKSKPFGRSYTIKYLGNVVEGNPIRHLNVTMSRLKELILASLQNKEVVWFGSDVANYGIRKEGIWDDKAFSYEETFGLTYLMDKGQSIDYLVSAMNHAMVITGVALNNSVPTKWKIQNSWGTNSGNQGFYVMSNTWFDQYVYQAVVNKKYLTKEELEAYESSPIVLKPWDPMGSLAD